MQLYKNNSHKKPLFLWTASSLSLFLGCCTSSMSNIESRISLASDLASGSALHKTQINTPKFTFTAYEKITNTNAPISLYIEGDGLAWISRTRPSGNPTPTNPVALRLAAQDSISQNIIYIARPCQYTPITKSRPCNKKYWTSERFAPEVIESYIDSIDAIKQQYQLTDINLIGYSGGGTIAALLAEQRDDIASLRTVAGNLDIEKFNRVHNVSSMPKSLNPADNAYKAVHIPQIHFIGEDDKIVPASIFNSYAQKAGESSCIQHKIIPHTNHQTGWQERWPELIKIKPNCSE